MSADEFDPFVERLFSRSPQLPDAALFAAGVERKLDAGSRVRAVALTLAGLVGGVIAVRETLTTNLSIDATDSPVAGQALSRGMEAAGVMGQRAVQTGLEQLGLADVALGSMGGMQLFWLTAAALIALAAAGVMKLSQEI